MSDVILHLTMRAGHDRCLQLMHKHNVLCVNAMDDVALNLPIQEGQN